MKMFPIFEHAPVIVCSCILGLLLSPPTAHAVQAAQLRLAQANNLADIEWSAGLRRMQGIDETALVAGISVSLFQKERNLGEYEAHRARLDAIELQKQSNLRSLLHSVNQALGEHTRALLEVETIQLT